MQISGQHASSNEAPAGVSSEATVHGTAGMGGGIRGNDCAQARNKYRDNLRRQALDLNDARLAESSELCQEILEAVPDPTDALYLPGLIAHETGPPTQAVELIRRVLVIEPDQAKCYKIPGLT